MAQASSECQQSRHSFNKFSVTPRQRTPSVTHCFVQRINTRYDNGGSGQNVSQPSTALLRTVGAPTFRFATQVQWVPRQWKYFHIACEVLPVYFAMVSFRVIYRVPHVFIGALYGVSRYNFAAFVGRKICFSCIARQVC